MSIEGNTGGVRREYSKAYWNLYRRLRRLRPDLHDEMYRIIGAVVRDTRYDNPRGVIFNSTWLGDLILMTWPRTPEWMAFCGENRDLSRGLFGQIMWTVMYDDTAHDWHTILTENANPGREERVYFLGGGTSAATA